RRHADSRPASARCGTCPATRPPLYRWLSGLAAAGLLLQLGSGFALFAADATPLLDSSPMRLKLALVMAGIGNALLFRHRQAPRLASREFPSTSARIQAGLSLCIWL